MRQFKTLRKGMAAALAGGLLLCACSSEEDSLEIPEGKGLVRIGLSADTGFSTQTKAVTESDYENLENYTVQILENGSVKNTYSYTDIENTWISYSNGTYTVKAFYGEDKAVSTTSMYVEGSQDILISNDTAHVSFTCRPVCAKVTVKFDETMATYFRDYEVVFKTEALGEENYTWEKDFTDPVYMKVMGEKETVNAVIRLTKMDGTSTTLDKTYELMPAMQKTITMKPTVSGGNVGITITIDETTNDQEIEIEVPSDWV